MKPLHRYLWLTLYLIASLSAVNTFAQTQTESRYKSRLDIRPKPKTASAATPLSFQKKSFIIYQPQLLSLDRNIQYKRSTAINQYFSNSLLSSLRNNKSDQAQVAASINDNKQAAEEYVNMEDKLYYSDKLSVSNIYPNPANENVEIDYSISPSINEAKITFYNVLGAEVKEVILDKDDKKVRIQTRDLSNGIYLYQLTADGKSLVTKKLLVRHQL
ncbi:Por secretion system C-terminal sorting domain-containing protein [Pseudarcicella hirudinis]|uniref:Por secretion system C-terminal sorting domain-containing protein n=1 Tax=Pseudarcicella hirudinis TaxID=1079859 RepID=A0A1I5YGD3_9BACT|nr:T9SS type A sorting domain-containing protein [Pseudarcicella hirudinis]SFQ43276.1 Por secretion system C-terminal sorting domain-containing protein [Pseudarcicella hirudinis]